MRATDAEMFGFRAGVELGCRMHSRDMSSADCGIQLTPIPCNASTGHRIGGHQRKKGETNEIEREVSNCVYRN